MFYTHRADGSIPCLVQQVKDKTTKPEFDFQFLMLKYLMLSTDTSDTDTIFVFLKDSNGIFRLKNALHHSTLSPKNVT